MGTATACVRRGRIPKRPLPSSLAPGSMLLPAFIVVPMLLLGGCSGFVSPRLHHQPHARITGGSSSEPLLPMVVSSPPPPPPSAVLSSPEDKDEENGDNDVGGSSSCKFMFMTEEEDRLLKEQGDLEASLMQTPTALKAMKLTGLSKTIRSSSAERGMGVGNGGGFGGGGFGGGKKKAGKKKNNKKAKKAAGATIQEAPAPSKPETSPELLALTKAIREDGLVRIDNVLSGTRADDLREYLIDLRKRAKEDVETGAIEDSQQRFADVLLNQNRCDLKIPLGPKPVNEALLDVLNNENDDGPSLVRNVIEGVFDHYTPQKIGAMASLWELNCFMSNSGARRQLVHADCVCLDAIPGLDHTDTRSPSDPAGEPILLTCFIALQDIDASMGPTVFMPNTHNIYSHNVFFETGRDKASTPDGTNSPKNGILRSSKSLIGAPIPKGSCIIFDPRVLHCAGANQYPDAKETRALFYMTFKNPKVDSPGCPSTSGYGISNAELTMNELVSDLLWMERGRGTMARRVPLLASSP